MRLLSEKTVAQLLQAITAEQCQRLLHALTQALASLASQKGKTEPLIHQPLRSHIATKDGHVSLFMPASDTTTTGIKIVTVPGPGGDGINGVINVFSPEGRLKGLLSATEVTAFRTALATMSLLTCYQRIVPYAEHIRITIFGAGKQAEWHARLVLLVLLSLLHPLSDESGEKKSTGISISITFINRSRKRLAKLAENLAVPVLQQRYSPALREVNFLAREDTPDFELKLRSILWSTNVIFCCTPSTQPLFPQSYLDQPPPPDLTGDDEDVRRPPTMHGSGVGESDEESRKRSRFIALIGSYQPHMQEVEAATLLSGDCNTIFVDSKEACLKEAGELIMASEQGSPFELVEIAQLFSPHNDRTATASTHTITRTDSSSPEAGVRRLMPGPHNVIFKCVGMGIMDLVVAKVLLEIAEEAQLGMLVDDF
jgi:ornithine cyclodeaminase/alanine dehydrogenase-like protein (mu-crystallin family)